MFGPGPERPYVYKGWTYIKNVIKFELSIPENLYIIIFSNVSLVTTEIVQYQFTDQGLSGPSDHWVGPT